MPASPDLYVLDASAVLAVLFQEAGSEFVEDILPQAAISAANLTEVITKLVQRGETPANARATLEHITTRVIPVTTAIAQAAAEIAPKHPRISLGDRLCLATAKHESAIAVTGDKLWSELGLDIPIRQIRR